MGTTRKGWWEVNNGHGCNGAEAPTAFGAALASRLAEWEAVLSQRSRSGALSHEEVHARKLFARVYLVCWWFACGNVPRRPDLTHKPETFTVSVPDGEVVAKLVELGFAPKIAERIGSTPTELQRLSRRPEARKWRKLAVKESGAVASAAVLFWQSE